MKILISLILLLHVSAAFSWGQNGHRIIGLIADQNLSAEAKRKLSDLLGQDSLAELSTWGDFIRSDEAWRHAGPWHYVSISDGKTYESSKKNKKGDIIVAIKRYSMELKNKKLKRKQRATAVKMLVHFIGDIHQPLHVGRASDQGGNKIRLSWFGQNSNLHKVWDEHLIDGQKLSFTEYVSFLDKPSAEKIKKWQNSSVTDWASESLKLRSNVYDYPKKKKGGWEYKYIFKNRDIVNTRLLQAGYRLANELNKGL